MAARFERGAGTRKASNHGGSRGFHQRGKLGLHSKPEALDEESVRVRSASASGKAGREKRLKPVADR